MSETGSADDAEPRSPTDGVTGQADPAAGAAKPKIQLGDGVSLAGGPDEALTSEAGGQTPPGQQLSPLKPDFIPDQHQQYVDYIRDALDGDDSIQNIALTGSYGVGKSSVLEKIPEAYPGKVLTISLSSVGITESDSHEHADGERSDTNRIQKEIVKQLLYSELPTKVPGSRFKRNSKFRWKRELPISAAVAWVIALILVTLQLEPPVVGITAENKAAQLAGWVWLIILGSIVLTAARLAIHRGLWISDIKAGPATITLSGRTHTYFDEYLDEIISFFEHVEIDVVIFEDIDRFDDPHIFETLRELNTILNRAKQLDGRRVRFIYAIKDSIFAELGSEDGAPADADAAEAELARANRTKFFDVVVPMVPFITHRSARDLMTGLFRALDERGPSPAIISLAARHITDMRLLKNIRNEYEVFRQRLISKGLGGPGLTADRLLALILYKNLHLADFEKISKGDSDLDRLYAASRRFTQTGISRLSDEIDLLSREAGLIASYESSAEMLGTRLVEYVERVARHAYTTNWRFGRFEAGGKEFSVDEVGETAFWTALLDSEAPLVAFLQNATVNRPLASLTFEIGDLKAQFPELNDIDRFRTGDSATLADQVQTLKRRVDFLRYSDFGTLANAADVAEDIGGGGPETFGQVINRSLGSDLARELVKAGDITRNFTLHMSQYYGVHLSEEAMTFIVRNVQTGTMDMFYAFPGPSDVADVIMEVGEDFLDNESSNNIDIVDHLLADDDNRIDTICRRLVALRDPERAFVTEYLRNGKHPDKLVQRFAATWPGVFTFLASDADLRLKQRIDLLDAALGAAEAQIQYLVSAEFASLIKDNASRFKVLTGPEPLHNLDGVLHVLELAGVTFANIERLRPELRERVVSVGLYDLSASNLRSALSTADLALDVVKAANTHVYQRCLSEPSQYLELIRQQRSARPTVTSTGDLGEVVNGASEAGWNDDHLHELIARAARACTVTDLSTVPTKTWEALASENRFPATLHNVFAYVEQVGEIDTAIASHIRNTGSIGVSDESPATEKLAVANALLIATGSIPDPADRVSLVEGLGLGHPLNPADVPAEEGALLGLLIKSGLIADDAAAFERFKSLGWGTYAGGVRASAKFAEFVAPDLLTPALLIELLGDTSIDQRVGLALLDRFDEFISTSEPKVGSAAAEFAVRTGARLPSSRIATLASAGIAPLTILRLLQYAIDLSHDAVAAVLSALPHPYPRLLARDGSKVDIDKHVIHDWLVDRLKSYGDVATSRTLTVTPKIRVKLAG